MPESSEVSRLTRRQFSAASLISPPILSACATGSDLETQSPEGMTLGFSTYGMKTLKTEHALREIIRIGFDAVEITVWPDWDAAPARMSAERRRQMRKQITDGGLELSSLMEHVTPSRSTSGQTATIDRLNGVFDLAGDLAHKPPLVQTVLGGGKFDQEKERIRDRVGAWTEAAAKKNITLAIKPHRGGVVSQPKEGVWILDELGNPKNLKLVYDYSHYIFRDLSLSETLKEALPHIAHVAVKDAVEGGDRVVFQLPGSAGTIPFDQLLRKLSAGGYRGDISCEVSGMVWSRKGYAPVHAAETCYRNIDAAFTKAGVKRRRANNAGPSPVSR